MAGVKHTFSVGIADDASAVAASMVLPSHWNQEHTLSDVAAQTDLDALSAAVAAVSLAHVSLVSDVGRISSNVASVATRLDGVSAQMTSADNAISLAVATLSIAHVSLVSDVGRISTNHVSLVSDVGRISTNHVSLVSDVARISSNVASIGTRLDGVSGQMTSADNAISAAVAAVSLRVDSANAQHVSLVSDVGRISSNVVSIAARVDTNSTAHTSLVSNVASISVNLEALSANHTSLVSDVGRISTQVAAGLVSAGPIKRVLAGDQLLGATAPVSISGFTFTCSAGVGYHYEFGIFTSHPISLAASKYILSFPSSSPCVGDFFMGGLPLGPLRAGIDRTNVTIVNATVSAVGVPIAAYIRGTFRCSVANGTMALAMGNGISGGGAGSSITVLAGSYGYVWRMG